MISTSYGAYVRFATSTGSNCDHFPLLIPAGKLDSFRLAIRELIDSVNTTAFSFCSG